MNTNRIYIVVCLGNWSAPDCMKRSIRQPFARSIGKLMICLLVLIGMNAWGYGDSESSPEALLVSAAEEGNDQEIRHLLDLGVDVNSSYTVRPQVSAEAIRALTAQGIDIKSRFATLTALTRAISKNHSSTVRLLLESGADANLQSTNGTPLLIAITVNGSADMVKMLLEHGANPNSESDDNKSPLALLAALAKPPEAVQVEIARELIKFGALVDYQNARGATALMEAIDQNKLLFVKCLLDAGENPNKIRDPKIRELTEADVPLQEATTISASHNDLSMVRLLLDYGANPNYRNDRMHYDSDGPQGRWDGISPLVAAAESGEFAIAELLLERGADPCLIRTDGAAPYDIALKAGHREIARLIMARMTSASCVIGNLSKPGSSR